MPKPVSFEMVVQLGDNMVRIAYLWKENERVFIVTILDGWNRDLGSMSYSQGKAIGLVMFAITRRGCECGITDNPLHKTRVFVKAYFTYHNSAYCDMSAWS